MNVSMGDTFNLGWKPISVLTGRADASLLHSYSGERCAAAEGLVEFDHKWAEDDDTSGLPRVAREFVNNLPFTCGLTIQHKPSARTDRRGHAMPSMPVKFWNDSDGSRYRESYFDVYLGVWRHDDFFCINAHGGRFVLGRSDATLNRHGVRIGTADAEI